MNRHPLKLRIAVAVVGLSLLVAIPAPAAPEVEDSGMLNVDRWFVLAEGERTSLRMVRRVTDPAPNSSADTQLLFGESGMMGVSIRQGGATRRSRSVTVVAMGVIRDVRGRNCTISKDPVLDMKTVSCVRLGYNWRADRGYRVAIVRGGRNADGWKWIVRITDLRTKETTRLVSLRRREGRASDRHLVSAFMSPNDCSAINTFRTSARAARSQQNTLLWRRAERWATGCEGVQLRAPLADDVVRFLIE